jgi:adenylate cyclase
MEAHPNEELWRSLLTGKNPKLRQGRRLFAFFPTPDTQTARCKMCLSPFEGITAPIVRAVFGRRRWERCPYYCDVCENVLLSNPGGTELDTALLFADMRGSTGLATKMGPSEFSRLMQRFYSTATRVLTKHNGYIDKLIGDEVMALFILAMSGAHMARDAVLAAREILVATGHDDGEPWLPIGIGVHSGSAFVGSVGSVSGIYEMTALGDTVNRAARFASAAAEGEIVMSEATYRASGVDWEAEHKSLQLKGYEAPIDARVFRSVNAAYG